MRESTGTLIRRSLLRFLTVGAILETAWTIYIGLYLPRRYVANHWDLAWVGLDVAQVAMLSCSAWAAWRRSTLLVIYSTVSATLLTTDAWFDVTTARQGDVLQGILLAVLVEVPSAAVLLWVAHRGLRHTEMMPATSSSATARPKSFDDVDGFD